MRTRSHQPKSITATEIATAFLLMIMGYLFSTRTWLLWLNSLTPIEGLFVYYIVMYSALYLLSQFGLIIWKFEIKNASQVLGATMIVFAFFIVVDWTSPYVQYVTEGTVTGASTIFYQDEDGAVYYFWNIIIGIKDIEVIRLLTFVLTPFLLTLSGAFLVSKAKI